MRAESRAIKGLAIGWVGLFWVLCVALPVGAVLARAAAERLLSSQAFFDPLVVRIAELTLGQALLSAGISALIGLPLGLWMGGRAHGRPGANGAGGGWARFFLALPFGVPTVVAGLAWVAWLGRSGIVARWLGWDLDWAYSFKAVILAHVVLNAPWLALQVFEARLYLPPQQLEAAETLGAGPGRRFLAVIWPQVRWAFFSGCAQAWGFCAMSFALVLILGGGPPVQTLETALYSRVRFGMLNLPGAVLCACWELLITLLPWALVVFFQSRAASSSAGEQPVIWLPEAGAGSSGGAREWLRPTVAALFFAPYLIVLGRLTALPFSEIRHSLEVSLVLAGWSALGAVLTAIAALVALSVLERPAGRSGLNPGGRGMRWLAPIVSVLLSLPSGISILVLGLGFWLAYGRWIDPFAGSLWAMVALQATLFFPIAFRFLWPVARQNQASLVEAAATLGATPFQAFREVEWPRWRGPILGALAMVAGASLGELAAVSLFYNENLVPLPLLISRWMAQYRFSEAEGVAALLLLLSVGVMATVGLESRGSGEVFFGKNDAG